MRIGRIYQIVYLYYIARQLKLHISQHTQSYFTWRLNGTRRI